MLYFLAEQFKELAFLKSIYLRSIIAFVLAFLLVIFLGKPFIKYLKKKKYEETIRHDGPSSHNSKKGTPTMGGVLIVGVVLFTNFLVVDMSNNLMKIIIVATLMFASIGFIDDYKKFTVSKDGLSGRKKLLGQALIGFMIWLYMYFSGLTGDKVLDFSVINPISSGSLMYIGAFGMLILVLIIVMGTSNAVNITDGLDGLAIMPIIICASVFAVISYFTGHKELSSYLNLYYIVGSGEITIFLSAICGSGLAFLWYNCYPAEIFMGDTGSLTLGGCLGVIAILLKQELLLPIIGGIFVLEALSVIIQVVSFKSRGKRVFKMAPIHHHFELCGMNENKVTMRFWISNLMLGIVALGLVRFRGLM